MYFGASLLMYFGSEPQRCNALGAILDICTHICYIYEKLDISVLMVWIHMYAHEYICFLQNMNILCIF